MFSERHMERRLKLEQRKRRGTRGKEATIGQHMCIHSLFCSKDFDPDGSEKLKDLAQIWGRLIMS